MTPTVARPATSVLLLRDGPDGQLELFALVRAASMVFAGGFTAYPGGAVDATDAELPDQWIGPDAQWWSDRLQLTDPLPWVLCAVRELFEEVGVALVDGPGADPARRAALQSDLAAHRVSLARGCAALGWTPNLSGLRPWARWITPGDQPRRYDTLFFAAALPAGQEALLATTEADAAVWITPAELLARADRGELRMMPPTAAMAHDLAAFPDVRSVLSQDRTVTPVRTRIVSRPGEPLRVVPDDRPEGVR